MSVYVLVRWATKVPFYALWDLSIVNVAMDAVALPEVNTFEIIVGHEI